MRLLITSANPWEAASHLDDKLLTMYAHVGTQMLCTALYNRGLWSVLLYPPTCEYYMCVQWAAASRNNFIWVYHYVSEVIKEYRMRGLGRAERHLVVLGQCWDIFQARKEVFPKTELTEFPNDTPYKTYLHPEEAYRKYLLDDLWDDKTTWTINRVPKKKPWFYREPIKVQYPRNLFA